MKKRILCAALTLFASQAVLANSAPSYQVMLKLTRDGQPLGQYTASLKDREPLRFDNLQAVDFNNGVETYTRELGFKFTGMPYVSSKGDVLLAFEFSYLGERTKNTAVVDGVELKIPNLSGFEYSNSLTATPGATYSTESFGGYGKISIEIKVDKQ